MTPAAGLGYLFVFLNMQRGAWLHFKMIIRIEKYQEIDYNSRNFFPNSSSSTSKSTVKSDNETFQVHENYPNPNLRHHDQRHSHSAEAPMSEWNEEDLADEVEYQAYKVDMTRSSFDAVHVDSNSNESSGKLNGVSLNMTQFLKSTSSSSGINAYEEDSEWNICNHSVDYSISGNPKSAMTDNNSISINNPIKLDNKI